LVVSRTLTRRDLLVIAGLAALVPLAARAEGELVCAKPYAGDKKQRDALHYAEASPDPHKLCEGCQYFEARGKCGNCRIFSTQVNPSGTCDSWSKKAD
jgi:hypothetical protein